MDEFDLEEPINNEFDLEQHTADLVIPIKQTIEQPQELKGLNTDLSAPIAGYVAGKAVQKGIEKTAKAVSEAPEKVAMKIGGLTPEQVEYYKQNYKAIESGKGISQQAIDEAYSKLENAFKQKNIQANVARETAEQALDVPITQKLSKQAMEAALPKVLNKIPVESQAFKEKLQEQVSSKVESEITRLANLIEQKKQAVIDASEYAQSKAEKAAEIAVKKATPKKKLGLIKEPPIDTKVIYGKAFEEELAKSLPEQNKIQAKAIKDFQDYNKQIADLQNEYYQASNVVPEVRQNLIKSKTTELAKDYPSIYGYQDPSGKFTPQVKKIEEQLSDVSSLEKKEAADYLRASREMGWKKGAGGVPEVSSELSKAYTDELRSLMAPTGSKSDIEFKRVSSLLNQLKEAQQNQFITRNIGDVVDDEILGKFDPESVSIDLNNRKVINKVLNPSKNDLKDPGIKEARIALDRLIENPELVDQIKQAAIKSNLIDEKKAFKFGPFDALRLSFATSISSALPVGIFEGVKYAKTPEGAYKLATLAPRIGDIAAKYPTTSKIVGGLAKGTLKALPLGGAAIGAVAAQAAEEALSPEPSGATPQMPEYWLERGVRDPEEQLQKARLASFKEGLPAQGKIEEMPSAYEKPEIKQYKEQVMTAKKAGVLAPTYVEAPKEKVLKADNPAEIASVAQALQTSPDKASQEYSRVLSQIVDAAPREKESILFGLNQQPAFRELVRKLKEQQKTEEETPLMLKGPA